MKHQRERKRRAVAIASFFVLALTAGMTAPAAAEFCDGGFEDGPFSECWTVSCEILSTPWCNQELCGDDVEPRSGEAWHWHGGLIGETHGCSAKQGPIEFLSAIVAGGGQLNFYVDDVSLTEDELVFWLRGSVFGEVTGDLKVLVDGAVVWQVDEVGINDYWDRYREISIPLDGCTMAVKSQKLTVRPGRKLPVRLTVKHQRPKETKTAFVLTLRDSKGKAVATETTREYTFRYGATLRKTARFTVPKNIKSGHYTLEARLDGMKQGEVVSSDHVEVR